MAYILTNDVVLLNAGFMEAPMIEVYSGPLGTSSVYYFEPEFIIRPWPDEDQLPASITIELEVRILRPELFRFGGSMAVAKRYLLDSANMSKIGFTIRTLQDLDAINFHQIAFLFKTKDYSENFGAVESPFGFEVAYTN